MSNFERLLTRLKGHHSCREELDLISIEFTISFGILKKIFLNPRSSLQRGFIEIFELLRENEKEKKIL